MLEKAYWNGNGEEQAKYDEMCKAGFDDCFTKATKNVMHQYYRYYNDGDLPGWARSYYAGFKKWNPTEYGWGQYCGGWTLNEAGEQELEDRATLTIVKEYERYLKSCQKASA